MKLITRDTDYAIRALCYIEKNSKDRFSVDELVKVLKIPKAFLRKILQILSKKKVLKSYKGKNGGFQLVMPAKKIFLLDLVEIFQGKMQLNQCTFKKEVCPDMKLCAVKRKIDNIQNLIVREFKSISIASLIDKGG